MALKFKEGDKVRVIDGWDTMNGLTGFIHIADERAVFPYNVTMDEVPAPIMETCGLYNWMMVEEELELVEQ